MPDRPARDRICLKLSPGIGNTGLVILSNCQVADREFFNVLFDVMAELRRCEHPCGLILAGTGTITHLENLTRDRAASVRQYVSIPPLTDGDVTACLNAWCGKEGADLAIRAKSEAEAIEVIRQVAHSTDGNISRVKQFAAIKNDKFPNRAFTPGLVKDVFSALRAGGAGEAKK